MIGLLLSLALAGPLPDSEAPNPFLLQAKELYEQLDFEKCMQRIKQAGGWKGSSVNDLRDIELYGALCAFNLGQKGEAAERFRLALRIDEDLELPEFASPKAVRLFLAVKRKLRQPTVAPMPDEDMPESGPTPAEKAKLDPRPKEEEKPVEVTSPSALSRHVAPIGLGVGAVVVSGLGIGLGVNAKSLETQARLSRFESDYLAARSQAQANALGANIAYGVAALLVAAAIVVLFMQK